MSIRKRRSDRSGRVRLFSPGRPPVAGREGGDFGQRLRRARRVKMLRSVSVSRRAVGTRWFRKAGACRHRCLLGAALWSVSRLRSGRSRSLRVQGYSMREVARRLGRVASTISRELRRNAAPEAAASRIVRRQRNGTPSALLAAQSKAKLARNAALKTYVEDTVVWRRCGSERGSCSRPGRVLEKPASARTDGRTGGGASAWSPEQIARRLPVDFPDDATMRISAAMPSIKR